MKLTPAGRPLLLLALLASAMPGASAETDTALSLALRPVRASGTEVTGIEVKEVIHGPLEGFGFSVPIVYPGVTGVADRIASLTIRDAHGPVVLSTKDDPPVKGGFPYYRHWSARRTVVAPLTIRYLAQVQPTATHNGPPFGIRPSAGGVSGAGSTFIIVPDHVSHAQMHVRWDLSDMPRGSIAASSFGEDAFDLTGAPEQLHEGWYMSGPAGRFPDTADAHGFSAMWLGSPGFEPGAEMAQAADVYAYLGRFFAYLNPPPRYRVFIRVLDTPPFGGGTALDHSFMLSRGAAKPGEQPPRSTFVHEMVHLWIGSIEGPPGVTSWFSEGLTVYYTSLLQMRGNFVSVDDYIRDVNTEFRNYYTNPARSWTPEQIVQVGFNEESVRHIPYVRGMLYFADLDSQIRAASKGRRDLNAVMQDMFQRRAAGETFDAGKWQALVRKEAGESAVSTFQGVILRGETIVPASDAFGPCLMRRATSFENQGKAMEGFEWVRVASVPEERCRAGKASQAVDRSSNHG